MVHLQDLILVAKLSIYVMVLNIHHLVLTELQVVEHHHLLLLLLLLQYEDHRLTVVSPLISLDINVVNLNTEVGQVTERTAAGVSVHK